MENISIQEAQRLALASQKLIGPALELQKIIEHLGYIQIDTISVIERAHHHVLWARNQKYKPSDLDHLVKNRKVFEYWSHAASYLPMKEYRYTLPMKHAFQKKQSSWFPRDPKLMAAILKRIKSEGPLRSKDFENTKKGQSGWWDWKPSKKALERLFLEGKLEITQRRGFQKVYDLPENVIPNSVDTSMPTEEEYLRFLIQRTLRHHGLATISEIGYLGKKEIKSKLEKIAREMLYEGTLQEIRVENSSKPYLSFSNALENLPKVNSKIHILSPFDNLVIQRQKLNDLFDFDYQIECYVPASKRKFGYFCLPIFKGRHPIARVDCKADRQNQKLIIHSISYEKNDDRDDIKKEIASKLKSFAKFNGCKGIQGI
ncbi:MAG: YcaQ family DNA glycosylase [Bdellovibrionales bacterium]|nr:YcaQ family DNA glycosylase [Bdellovibrionales bacterium]